MEGTQPDAREHASGSAMRRQPRKGCTPGRSAEANAGQAPLTAKRVRSLKSGGRRSLDFDADRCDATTRASPARAWAEPRFQIRSKASACAWHGKARARQPQPTSACEAARTSFENIPPPTPRSCFTISGFRSWHEQRKLPERGLPSEGSAQMQEYTSDAFVASHSLDLWLSFPLGSGSTIVPPSRPSRDPALTRAYSSANRISAAFRDALRSVSYIRVGFSSRRHYDDRRGCDHRGVPSRPGRPRGSSGPPLRQRGVCEVLGRAVGLYAAASQRVPRSPHSRLA
jgi:hypothetical protein